ncbi:restriction endonuclease subunit S [Micrococcus luteus KDCGSN]|uniref:restriction endonuclease subunit S n=2 Tax=Micrococcaceae TaxID=1268 RepID=UPI003EEC4556
MSLPLKRLATVIAGQSPVSDEVEDLTDALPFIQGNAEFGLRHPSPKWQCATAPKVACTDDVLISVRAPVGATNIAEGPLGIGRGVAAVRATDMNPAYLYWFLTSSSDLLNAEATGSTFAAITAADLGDLEVPITDVADQRAIADYLDRETATIDALIEKQGQMKALLLERRRTAIDSCFPREADTRLSNVLHLCQTGPFGTQLSASEYIEGGVPVINPTHIVGSTIVPNAAVSVTAEKADALSRHDLVAGDIVLGRKGEVDKSALVSPGHPRMLLGSDSMLLRVDGERADPRYLWWWLQSPGCHGELERLSVGSTVA